MKNSELQLVILYHSKQVTPLAMERESILQSIFLVNRIFSPLPGINNNNFHGKLSCSMLRNHVAHPLNCNGNEHSSNGTYGEHDDTAAQRTPSGVVSERVTSHREVINK
jgi:hypothetical protein